MNLKFNIYFQEIYFEINTNYYEDNYNFLINNDFHLNESYNQESIELFVNFLNFGINQEILLNDSLIDFYLLFEKFKFKKIKKLIINKF